MSGWDSLTPVQADAVLATATACASDPDEVLGRLLPLLTDEPDTTPLTLLPTEPVQS